LDYQWIDPIRVCTVIIYIPPWLRALCNWPRIWIFTAGKSSPEDYRIARVLNGAGKC